MVQSFLQVLFLITGFLSPCFASLQLRINEDLGSLDWNRGEVVSTVMQQLMVGLTRSGPSGKALPELAEKWKVSKHSNEYVFYLRKEARWSDGEKVCAEHFVDSWSRALSKDFSSPYAHLLFDIKNARQFHSGEVKKADLGIKSDGCHILKVNLERPIAYFPELVSHWVFYPIRKDLIEKYNAQWTRPEHLVVTGPYLLESWTPDKEYLLKKNEKYYQKTQGENQIRAIVVAQDSTALTLFDQEKIDWIKDLPYLEKEKQSKRQEYKLFPTFVEYHLGFTKKIPKNLRCAISRSLNKNQIPRILKGGEIPAKGFVHPEMFFYKINQLSEESPQLSAEFKNQEVDIYYYSKDIHQVLMEWIQAELKNNLGIRVNLIKMDGKTYWAKLKSDPPPIFLSGITAAYGHPYSFMSEFLTESPANWGKFSFSEYDQLSQEVSKLNSSSKRDRLIEKAQDILMSKECTVVPLYFRKTAALVSKKISGFEMNPMTYLNLEDVIKK